MHAVAVSHSRQFLSPLPLSPCAPKLLAHTQAPSCTPNLPISSRTVRGFDSSRVLLYQSFPYSTLLERFSLAFFPAAAITAGRAGLPRGVPANHEANSQHAGCQIGTAKLHGCTLHAREATQHVLWRACKGRHAAAHTLACRFLPHALGREVERQHAGGGTRVCASTVHYNRGACMLLTLCKK
jgi:hypothetical protein